VTDPNAPTTTVLAPPALTSLLASLNEVQQTIRAYDTKAQIMGVGFIFSITMVGKLLENLPVAREYDLGYLIGGFLLLIGPVTLFGMVLYPSRRSAPETETDGSRVRGCFYFVSDGARDFRSFVDDIDKADWKVELAYEITRLSALRDLKRRRFLMAMFAAGGSFAAILLANVLKLGGML
jgi:hypothetical protein